MKRSYLDYAMSVIVSRALPDVRDGLKPVHRRILYAMHENGFTPDRTYIKSARIVGDVMGKYHPHGDPAIYDALVRMAQAFSMRLPLIDGQGNFGSVDGDPAGGHALHRIAVSREPAHGAARRYRQGHGRFPAQLRRQGAGAGRSCRRAFPIFWSMARAASRSAWRPIFRRTISARSSTPASPISRIRHIDADELIEIVPGPDFPTGAHDPRPRRHPPAYHTGRGSIVMRARSRDRGDPQGARSASSSPKFPIR